MNRLELIKAYAELRSTPERTPNQDFDVEYVKSFGFFPIEEEEVEKYYREHQE